MVVGGRVVAASRLGASGFRTAVHLTHSGRQRLFDLLAAVLQGPVRTNTRASCGCFLPPSGDKLAYLESAALEVTGRGLLHRCHAGVTRKGWGWPAAAGGFWRDGMDHAKRDYWLRRVVVRGSLSSGCRCAPCGGPDWTEERQRGRGGAEGSRSRR